MSSEIEKLLSIKALSLASQLEDYSWADEVSRGDFLDALRTIESELVEQPDALDVRLWWVRLRYETASLPAAALSSPLEEIYPKLDEQAELLALAYSTHALIGNSLLERKQSRIAVLLLERAFELASKDETCAENVLSVLHAELMTAIDAEVTRAKEKFEKKIYIKELEEKKRELKKRAVKKASKSKPKSKSSLDKKAQKSKKARRVFNSKSILTSTLEEESASAADVESSSEAERDGEQQSAELAALGQEQGESIFSSKRRSFAILLFILGVGVLGYYYLQPAVQPLPAQLAMNTQASAEVQMALPSSEMLSRANSLPDKALDSVQARLEKLSARDEKPLEAESEDPVEEALKSPEVDREAVLNANQAPAAASGTPELPATGLANAKVENLDRLSPEQQQAAMHTGKYIRGADGRLYGPGYKGGTKGPKALDGTNLRAYEVEPYDPPALFRTITETNVLESPSVISPTMARLKPNAKIQVISRMGQWLELRSTGGRRGYIYSQDAVQMK